MTDEEFNKVTKELDVVLLDVNYKNFETPLDVAKVCITLGKINERFLTDENKKLEEKLQHREHCIDWIMENYPEVISKYLEREK